MRILGFGADVCEFELELGRLAVKNHLASAFNVSRYDPYAEFLPGVTEVDSNALHSEDFPYDFDLVTARWALHHVAPEARWEDLRSALRSISPQGHFLVVEESDFSDRNSPQIHQRLYRLLLMATDVVINTCLRPDRTKLMTQADETTRFELEYLDLQDLEEIDGMLSHPETRRTAHPVGPHAGQTVFVWHVHH
ncbi:hypothetical protein [Streptomyces lavendulocolor]|uniref:hypothetical protein n=1 Tax=Streptomyces lavendulocolor TaxID=67316 RepID=UPI003402697B